jgi:hypothetical protein
VWKVAPILGLLALVGLHDKVVFLAAGCEVYGPLAVAFLFPGVDMIVAAKLVMVIMWMGAATSKLNKHFPFVLSMMLSNSGVNPRWLKRRFFEDFPDDLRPGRQFRLLAYAATVAESVAPLVLLFSLDRCRRIGKRVPPKDLAPTAGYAVLRG